MTDARCSLILGGWALFACTVCAARDTIAADLVDGAKRPNIIHFMSDDQGWGHTGYGGHPVIKTPNLDDMAANGLRLDRFYVACPKCSPTRFSVMTGLHPYRYQFFNGKSGGPLKEKNPDRSIAEIAAAAGYATAHFGKWHLGSVKAGSPTCPTKRGFQHWRSCEAFVAEQDPLTYGEDGKQYPLQGNGSQAIVAEAIKFIRQAAAEQTPFLVVIWPNDPHAPWKPPREDAAMFKGQNAAAYFGEISQMDRALGMVRQELRHLKLADNTLLWFNSDNGASGGTSNLPLRGGKLSCWEGGIRVPGLVEWPARIKPGSRTAVPVSSLDLMPTLAALLHSSSARQPAPSDGVNLLPLFDGQMAERPKPIPFAYTQPVGLIDNRYKICRGDPGGGGDAAAWHLYDLVADPAESHNLAAQQPELLAKLQARLEQWIESTRVKAKQQ